MKDAEFRSKQVYCYQTTLLLRYQFEYYLNFVIEVQAKIKTSFVKSFEGNKFCVWWFVWLW